MAVVDAAACNLLVFLSANSIVCAISRSGQALKASSSAWIPCVIHTPDNLIKPGLKNRQTHSGLTVPLMPRCTLPQFLPPVVNGYEISNARLPPKV